MPLESAIIRQAREGLALGVLEGRLEYGPELQNIKKQLMPLVEKRDAVLILDLSKVESVDSAGLGMLLFLNGAARDVGASLRLAAPSPRLMEIFQITHCTAIFIIDPDVDSSLKHAAKPI
jgi:anti-sigma B factor antagonist